jgi:hypothetical protein
VRPFSKPECKVQKQIQAYMIKLDLKSLGKDVPFN